MIKMMKVETQQHVLQRVYFQQKKQNPEYSTNNDYCHIERI